MKRSGVIFILSIVSFVLFLLNISHHQSHVSFRHTKSVRIRQTAQVSYTAVPIGYNRVTRVIDGDTIEVEINGNVEKVRLIGVDTPETVDPRKIVQCFGKEASEMSKKILTEKNVKLESDSTQTNRDKYNRLLRYVYIEDGTLVNKYLIEKGFGHEYTYHVPYMYQIEFKQAEKYARENSLGLWAPGVCAQ